MQRDMQHLIVMNLHRFDDHFLAFFHFRFAFNIIDQLIELGIFIIAPVEFAHAFVIAAMQHRIQGKYRVRSGSAPAEHVHAVIELALLGKIIRFGN